MNNKVIIIDRHPAIRLGLNALLSGENSNVVGEADNYLDALKLYEELRPGTVVLDAGQTGMNGLLLIGQLRKKLPTLKVIVFTAQVSNHLALRYMSTGADGLVYKHDNPCMLVNALRTIKSGYVYFPGQKMLTGTDDDQDEQLLRSLSQRELIVCQKLVQGLNNKAISELMALSQKTINTYKTRIFEKLNINTLVDLYRLATRNGLVEA